MITTIRNKYLLLALASVLAVSQWLVSHHVHNYEEHPQAHAECSFYQHRSSVDLVSVDSHFACQPITPLVFDYQAAPATSADTVSIVRYQTRAPPVTIS